MQSTVVLSFMRSIATRLLAKPLLIALVGIAAGLSACAGKMQESPAKSVFALEGPPLAIVAEYKGMALEGTMDRHVMVGIGKMELRSVKAEQGFFCEGRINQEPTEKARIRGMLDCTEGVILFITLSNLGPDQGVGVGRAGENQDLLTMFYHTSKEEAQRRFPAIKEALMQAGPAQK